MYLPPLSTSLFIINFPHVSKGAAYRYGKGLFKEVIRGEKMAVIQTDQWLKSFYFDPKKICEKLLPYFRNTSAHHLYQYLTMHGMYRPHIQGEKEVKILQKRNVWELVEKEEKLLRQVWQGPNVPIIIFPADQNRKIKRDFNGKSGLAFKDKLFLFISPENTDDEIRALLTHEYNHVCRLAKYNKNEDNYVLLDTVIMEGLAERAVGERLGEALQVNWTSYYSDEQLDKMWKNIIYPNRNISMKDRRHQDLLYGLRLTYPKMVGYCVGYFLVKKYAEKTGLTSKELLPKRSEVIAQMNN